MKKLILIMTGFAVLITGAYCGNYLFAQAQPGGTGAPAQPGGGAVAPAQPGTKVAVVNIGLVFNEYVRAKAFKADLERTLDPYKKKAKTLTDEMKKWADDMRAPNFKPENRAHYEAAIVKHQRELEDMERTVKDLLGKKQEDNLVTLWKEVNMGIEGVAKAYGFQIVLGFGDPMQKEMLGLFPNINRKMQAMDLGSTVPLYLHSSVDLSQAIADTLNRWANPDPKGIQPASK